MNAPVHRAAAYAVKMLHENRQQDPVAIEMLAREAHLGRQVSHPHLIAILESQIRRAPQFLVMPWLEGATLQAYASARRLLDPPAVLWIGRQTAEALDALDRSGWRHGDIKPSNIFLSPQGHVTLLDLGLRGTATSGLAVGGRLPAAGITLLPSMSARLTARTSAAIFIAWA